MLNTQYILRKEEREKVLEKINNGKFDEIFGSDESKNRAICEVTFHVDEIFVNDIQLNKEYVYPIVRDDCKVGIYKTSFKNDHIKQPLNTHRTWCELESQNFNILTIAALNGPTSFEIVLPTYNKLNLNTMGLEILLCMFNHHIFYPTEEKIFHGKDIDGKLLKKNIDNVLKFSRDNKHFLDKQEKNSNLYYTVDESLKEILVNVENILRYLLWHEDDIMEKFCEIFSKECTKDLTNIEKNKDSIAYIIGYLAVKPRLNPLCEKFLNKIIRKFEVDLASLWKNCDTKKIKEFFEINIVPEFKEQFEMKINTIEKFSKLPLEMLTKLLPRLERVSLYSVFTMNDKMTLPDYMVPIVERLKEALPEIIVMKNLLFSEYIINETIIEPDYRKKILLDIFCGLINSPSVSIFEGTSICSYYNEHIINSIKIVQDYTADEKQQIFLEKIGKILYESEVNSSNEKLRNIYTKVCGLILSYDNNDNNYIVHKIHGIITKYLDKESIGVNPKTELEELEELESPEDISQNNLVKTNFK